MGLAAVSNQLKASPSTHIGFGWMQTSYKYAFSCIICLGLAHSSLIASLICWTSEVLQCWFYILLSILSKRHRTFPKGQTISLLLKEHFIWRRTIRICLLIFMPVEHQVRLFSPYLLQAGCAVGRSLVFLINNPSNQERKKGIETSNEVLQNVLSCVFHVMKWCASHNTTKYVYHARG